MSALPPVTYNPLTRTDFVRYAGASGDFNPLHHDAEFAQAAGLPDVMGHGMLSAGLLASAITSWFGSGKVRALSVRFEKPVWPGDVLTAYGERQESGEAPVLVLRLVRSLDDVVLSGTAEVSPPSSAEQP